MAKHIHGHKTSFRGDHIILLNIYILSHNMLSYVEYVLNCHISVGASVACGNSNGIFNAGVAENDNRPENFYSNVKHFYLKMYYF